MSRKWPRTFSVIKALRKENKRLRAEVKQLARVDLAVARMQIMELRAELKVLKMLLLQESVANAELRAEIKQLREDLVVQRGIEVTLHELVEKRADEVKWLKREVLPISGGGVDESDSTRAAEYLATMDALAVMRERWKEADAARYEARAMSDEMPVVEVSGPDPLGVEAYLRDGAAEGLDVVSPDPHADIRECSCDHCSGLRKGPADGGDEEAPGRQ